jgi:hypothetical protein
MLDYHQALLRAALGPSQLWPLGLEHRRHSPGERHASRAVGSDEAGPGLETFPVHGTILPSLSETLALG